MRNSCILLPLLLIGCTATPRPTLSMLREALPNISPGTSRAATLRELGLNQHEAERLLSPQEEDRLGWSIERAEYSLKDKGRLELVFSGSPHSGEDLSFLSATLFYTNANGRIVIDHFPQPTLSRCLRVLPTLNTNTSAWDVTKSLHLLPDVELISLNFGHSSYNLSPQGTLDVVISYNSIAGFNAGYFHHATLTYANDTGEIIIEQYP